MCLIVFAYRAVPGQELVLLANRDEFLHRPAIRMSWWDHQPQVLAGRDLEAGGTWMGINRRGSWSAITNYREPGRMIPNAPSRGHLVSSYLEENITPLSFVNSVAKSADRYNGYNLLCGAGEELVYFSNRNGKEPQRLRPGIYGLSNAFLDTPWPKVEKAKRQFYEATKEGRVVQADLQSIMRDTDPAPDPELPHTGVPPEVEKGLSSPFIHIPSMNYGTRLTTLLTISDVGDIQMTEWGRTAHDSVMSYRFHRTAE